MVNKKVITLFLVIVILLSLFIFFPFFKAFTFIEYRAASPMTHYMLLDDDSNFQIRYVHSIHLTDVIETYEVTRDEKIKMISMTYEDLAIGLPGYAAEGETFSMENGKYTLTYNDNVIDSFTFLVGNVDAELAFRYKGNEVDLKKQLVKGKSYTFSVAKLSFYELLKGVDINVEK